MSLALRFSQTRHEALPPEIYLPLVDSLYRDGRTLFAGTIFGAGSIFITYWKTSNVALLYCTLAFIGVACARGLLMQAYFRATVTTNEAGKGWEYRYVAGAALSMAVLGTWCYIAFAQTQDPFADLVSFSMTLIYAGGIFGRNFGNVRFVVVQILCALVPMVAALLLYGNAFHWIFAGLLTPAFFGMKFIAERLRRTLLDAVIASRDMSLLATRFDTALNNMPHGLCMFDAERRVVVANQKLNNLLGLSEDVELKGSTARELVDKIVNAGGLSHANAENLVDRLTTRLSGNDDAAFRIETLKHSSLEFTMQPMENGGMVALVEDITERMIAEARINHLARFDALTGLPNRTVLRDRMEHALGAWRPDKMCAIHFVDLDQFKQINDTLGHSRGDMLLEEVAERLKDAIRDVDVISRFGGDEFVVLQAPIKSLDEAEALAARILSVLSGTYDLDGHKVAVTASIGIAVADHRIDPDQFLRNADLALYQAKADGRGTWRWFESKMEANAQARRTLEFDLRTAAKSEEFEIYYQPLFNLKTKRIDACEALLRWQHHKRGMVSPAEFIPVAEEMGLIVEIGNHVLYNACLECRRWPGDTSVAVNLSSIQFDRSNVPALVRETLAATNLAPHRLELEITESTLLQNTKRVRADLQQLAELGVRISLDDFGTAYSSLSYLHSFPLHKVKIDQSFLQGLGDDERRVTLLRGITRLSAQLGLRVVVEGVETEQQLELLAAEESIDEVQGYLLCRPMPAADLRKLLYASYVAPTQNSPLPPVARSDAA
ncbi:MAG: EAL domain-containing protein [Hyphomicrobiales bacterium]|nr:EAL domain-containing protein [Hyphomicrobiales bacterium]